MNKVLAVLRDNYRTLSLREFVAFVWGAMFKSETTLVYGVLLSNIEPVNESGSSKYAVVKGERGDLERARQESEPVPWELRCDAYDGVEDFFVYRDLTSGTIGHISWLYYKGDPNRTLRLADKECEIMFCLTLPEFRGLGLYPGALRAIQQYLKRKGYERCFICVNDDNVASIRGIEKAGFRRAGSVHFRKMFGIQVSRRRKTKDLRLATSPMERCETR